MNRLGIWSALAYSVLGAAYVVVVAIGMAQTGLVRPIVDPILAVMEVITLVGAPLLVIVMATIHASASTDARAYSATALAFMTIAAGLTSAVHFVGLTALRQVGAGGLSWPSPLYALELLAWDVFLGLALVSGAPVFRGDTLKRTIRICLFTTGSMCILGTLGPATGDMRIQFIAVGAYGVLLPLTVLLLAMDFRRAHQNRDERTVA
jgi:hypothetical protein